MGACRFDRHHPHTGGVLEPMAHPETPQLSDRSPKSCHHLQQWVTQEGARATQWIWPAPSPLLAKVAVAWG